MFNGVLAQMEQYKQTGQMSKELANFFGPQFKMDKFLINALSTSERNKMKDAQKKNDEYQRKLKALEK